MLWRPRPGCWCPVPRSTATSKQPAFDLSSTYIHLRDESAADPLAVDESFWSDLAGGGGDRGLDQGRLVMIFEFSGDWDQWAVHPAGDEVVYLLDCAVDLVLEADDGERVIELREQSPCCIVPRGVWHTARVPTPSRALHITPGAVTRHRPA